MDAPQHHNPLHAVFLLAALSTDGIAISTMNLYIIISGAILTTCGIIHYLWLFSKWFKRNYVARGIRFNRFNKNNK